MFAVIRTGGKQFKVKKDDKFEVPKLDAKVGDTISLDEVLYVNDGKNATTGSPTVQGAQVKATIVKQKRADKIIVFKKKRRQNYRRKNGHRQDLTVLQITDIKTA